MNYFGHTVTNLTLGTAAVAATLYFSEVPLPLLAAFSVAFVVATFFLSPDLDLHYSSPTRNWKMLRIIWYPYSCLFRHRGLSHSVLFGSMTRIGYLLLLGLGIIWILDRLGGQRLAVESLATAAVDHKAFVIATVCGIATSDFIHIVIGDRLLSALKYVILGKK